jgi:tetratricopeptide (TPR) repeat protein
MEVGAVRIASRQYSDEGQLAEIEGRLAGLPDALDLCFERACCLGDLGWNEVAGEAYCAVLRRDPSHLGALTNLGLIARSNGDVAAARTFLVRALAAHPRATIAQVNLVRILLEAGDVIRAMERYAATLELDPEFFAAHHGLALLYEQSGDPVRAKHHLERAFEKRQAWTRPYAADMAERADHRDEERTFLSDMRAALSASVVKTLESIARILGLDYGGIDFGIDAAGNVVVFARKSRRAGHG